MTMLDGPDCECLICQTDRFHDEEQREIDEERQRVEHWLINQDGVAACVGYRSRFEKSDDEEVPDELWVQAWVRVPVELSREHEYRG